MLRFKMIFWLGVGVLTVSFAYIFMCTFLVVPEEDIPIISEEDK